MSDMTLFENNAIVNSDLFKSLRDVNDNLLSGSGGGERNRRISLAGNAFREIVNGEEVHVSDENNMNMVILNAAKISRTYYEGTYSPGTVSPPVCWSADTEAPSPDVPEEQRQAKRCLECPQNVKGSGQGESRACRYGQRIAVALEGQLDKVYQLQLPATSIFGTAKDGNMPMRAYANFLNSHNVPAIAVVTNMRFDKNANVPKLFFKAVRPLDEAELNQVVALKDDPATLKAITLTVAQTDKVDHFTPKEEVKAKVDEPKKVVTKKAAPEPEEEGSLSSIIDDWDD